ncbi:hypothetical protein B296_00006596 [Ensete ventricosum]|uniref:Uncharacterized protein n=1 Tax=Ensete ventricosum TaxID=4639 RepID=A0A427AB64_ENSVE|nr:hypothetical protein B296_00006596 [Ensete ventricosum]
MRLDMGSKGRKVKKMVVGQRGKGGTVGSSERQMGAEEEGRNRGGRRVLRGLRSGLWSQISDGVKEEEATMTRMAGAGNCYGREGAAGQRWGRGEEDGGRRLRRGDEEGWPTVGADATVTAGDLLAAIKGRRVRGRLGYDRGDWEKKEVAAVGCSGGSRRWQG